MGYLTEAVCCCFGACLSFFFFGLCIATTCFFLLVFWVPSPLSGPPPATIERMRSPRAQGKLDLTLLEYESHNVMQMGTSKGKQGVLEISLLCTCKFYVPFFSRSARDCTVAATSRMCCTDVAVAVTSQYNG